MARTKLLLGLILLCMVAGCGDSASESPPIVVIGFDSADWTWIDQLAEDGGMPNFVAMTTSGVRADLKSLVPAQKSPTIWTSIATGKRPVKHGIADFIARREKVQTSELRKSAAYWDVLGALGHRQAVLGWWVTFPATPINGVLVSDFVPYLKQDSEDDARAVYPPEMWPTIDSLRVRPSDISLEELAPFVDLSIARQHGDDAWRLLERLREFLANDRSYLAMARYLYASEDFQCFTVYFRGLDMVSHEYWKYFQPHVSGLSDDSWQVRMLREVVPNYYAYVDELLGEVRGFVKEGSRVVVVSDHGFFGHRRTDNGLSLGVGMHRENGILLMDGPGIRAATVLERAEVKDIMPTLLVMSGVPVARDLDGHVLGDAFEPSVQSSFDRMLSDAIDSYDALRVHGDGGEVSDETNEAVLEQLRSLGYIE